MNFIKHIQYDLQQGLFRRWYLFCLPLIFATILCLGTIRDVESFRTIRVSNLTAGNLFSCFFIGIDEYIPAPGIPFRMPLEWFLILIYPLCLIADYPVRDLKGTGELVLLKAGSRKKWILSKFCWSGLMVTVYWLVLILSAVLMGAIFCSPSLFPNREFMENLIGRNFAQQNPFYLVFSIYILPYLVMLLSGTLHIVLSLCLSPFFSILIISSFKIAAAYYMFPVLPSEYTMLLRNICNVSNGFYPSVGLMICAVLIAGGTWFGCVYFCHYDILQKKEV